MTPHKDDEQLQAWLQLQRELQSPATTLDRRKLLRLALVSAATILLPGCEITERDNVQSVLRQISHFNDGAQATLLDPGRRATEYAPSQVTTPFRFNAFYSEASVPEIDGNTWRLQVAGRVARPRDWALTEIKALTPMTECTRLICIEGWSAVGQWTGVPLHHFLQLNGADIRSKYVAFRCADGYYTSIDMASALHPQTMLAFGFSGADSLPDEFGFPLRLRIPIKLGFKNPKHLVALTVTNDFTSGYWEDLHGYNWFAGL